MDEGKLSFQRDIRPLFSDLDVDHMKPLGIDLSDASSVQESAAAIYSVVTEGTMPPPSSGERWSSEMCERFKRWMDQGFAK